MAKTLNKNEYQAIDDGSFGVHTFLGQSMYPTHTNGCIIIIAEKEKVEELLKSPIVEESDGIRNGMVSQLLRLRRTGENGNIQLWAAKRWGAAR